MFKKFKEMQDGRTLFAFGLGLPEAIIIGVVIVALFFGGRKIGDWARGLGRFTTEFKRGKMEAEQELEEIKQVVQEK